MLWTCASAAPAQEVATQTAPLFLSAQAAADLALENNPAAAVAAAGVSAAWARVIQQHAARMPVLSATLYGLSSAIPSMWRSSPGAPPADMVPIPTGRQATFNATAQFPLFTGGRLRSMERARRHDALAEEASLQETQLDVRFMALVAYRQVLLRQAVKEIADQTVVALTESFRVAQERYNVGKIARVDLLRQQSVLADAQADLVEAEGAITHAENSLRAVLALDQGTAIGLTDPLAFPDLDADRDEMLSLALGSRPAMAAADARILAAGGTLAAIRGEYSPQIYLFGGADANALASGSDLTGGTIGLSVSLPLLDGGRRSGKREEARAILERRTEERRQTAIEIDHDLSDALVDYQTARAQVSLANQNVAAADEAFRVTQVAYDNGKTILAEVYDALAVQVRVHVLRVDAVYRAQVAVDRLERVLGSVAPGAGALTPYPAGWQALSISTGDAGEVAITSKGLTVIEFLVAVSREENLYVHLRTVQNFSGSVDGVFRGASLAGALTEALRPYAISAEVADGVLTIGGAVAP